MRRFLVVVVCVSILSSIFVSPVEAYYTNMPATFAIGQPDLTSGNANQNGGSTPAANTLSTPRNVAVVGQKVIIPDFSNNRVLIYNRIPTSSNVSADVVIGQPDMASSSVNQGGGSTAAANTLNNPEYVATDGTRLFVCDYANHRVLIFNQIPTTNNVSADVVIGQTNFSGTSANQGGSVNSNTLQNPVGLATDGTKLFIVDSTNNRVLIYNSIPTINNASADVVLGQADFTHNFQNRGTGAAAANNLNTPFGVSTGNGKLFVGDVTNHRILIWNSIPTGNGANADVVIGQPNFTSRSINQGQANPSANTLRGVQNAEFSNGRLFVSDPSNFRLLIFNQVPTVNNASADIVLGQPDFFHANSVGSPNATTFQNQFTHIEGGTLFLQDVSSNRILVFLNTTTTPGISLNTPITNLNTGRYRLTGNVFMNNNGGTYGLQTLSADLNGTGYGQISFPSGRTDTGGNSTYDFNYDFDPTVGGGSINNLTIKLLASTFNADTNTLFYFLPFNFKSFNVSNIKSQSFTFSVNKDQLQRVKDNLDHFEVWYRPNTTTGVWVNYISNISKSQIDTNGTIVATKTTNLTKFIGSYIFKVVAIDNWGNKEDSNYLYTAGTAPITLLTSYPSFGKSFVTAVPSASPISQTLTSPTPPLSPTVTPKIMTTDLDNTQTTTFPLKYYLFFGGSVIVLVGFLVLLLKRRKKRLDL